MQLKKKLTVARNTLVVSALTAAMLVGGTPAFANEGLHRGNATHFEKGIEKGFSAKAWFKSIAKNEKSEKRRDHRDEDRDRTTSATATDAAVACRTNAAHVHNLAIKSATTVRDAEMKAARDAFLAATSSARNQYRIDISASATATASASGTAETDAARKMRKDARTRYHAAVKTAETKLAAAKHKVMSDYRAAVRVANDTHKSVRLACRPASTQ